MPRGDQQSSSSTSEGGKRAEGRKRGGRGEAKDKQKTDEARTDDSTIIMERLIQGGKSSVKPTKERKKKLNKV